MLIYKIIAFSIFVSMLSSCGVLPTFNNLNSDYTADSDDAVIVLGVTPRYRIGAGPGRYNDEIWEVDNSSILKFNIFPENGYIVTKLPELAEGEAYAITQVLPEGLGAYVPHFTTCSKLVTLSFNSARGKVLYIGDIHYIVDTDAETEKPVIKIGYENNLENAKRNLSKLYPKLAPLMESGDAKLVHTNIPCAPAAKVI